MAHALFLEALMAQTDWAAGEVAFHGGTSLHLSWSSPRYSEDLDFLLSRNVKNLPAAMRKVHDHVGEMLRRIDPEFVLETVDRTRDPARMPVYELRVSKPNVIGKSMIKVEFWRTDPAYLASYPTELKTPRPPMAAGAGSGLGWSAMISNFVPAATLETAYADKLVAFATRPHLKWRDLYDLWWIGTQSPAALDMDRVHEQFQHNVTAYTPLQGLAPVEALALFLDNAKPAIAAKADPDLKNWLPPALWARLQPKGVEQIISYVFESIERFCDYSRDLERERADRPRPRP